MEPSNSSPDTDLLSTDTDLIEFSSKRKTGRLFQVDLFKAWMILLVIMDHTFTHSFLFPTGAIFWERIAIPGFMVILGFNAYNSFEKQDNSTLKGLYTKDYFKKKIERYIIPYLILYLIQGLIRITIEIFNINVNSIAYYENDLFMWLGYTPFYGPGMWFMPVLFGSIIVLPFLYYCFKKNFFVTFISCFIIEIFIQFMLFNFYFHPNAASLTLTFSFITRSIGFLLSGVAIGMWIGKYPKMDSIYNALLYFLWFFNFLYMMHYFNNDPATKPFLVQTLAGDYHFLTFGWAGMIFLVILDLFPNLHEGKFRKWVSTISKSTYHILLAQMLYFSIVYHFFLVMYDRNNETFDVFDGSPLNYIWFFPLNILITFTLGIYWKKGEDWFYAHYKDQKNTQILYKGVLILGIVAFFLWQVAHIGLLFVEVFAKFGDAFRGFLNYFF